ncbi:hypothetical protein J6590_010245 [Homalodisca vitripennis]|nr:hypothetical protein J6590_010245 [Homalodisca vitripennis]
MVSSFCYKRKILNCLQPYSIVITFDVEQRAAIWISGLVIEETFQTNPTSPDPTNKGNSVVGKCNSYEVISATCRTQTALEWRGKKCSGGDYCWPLSRAQYAANAKTGQTADIGQSGLPTVTICHITACPMLTERLPYAGRGPVRYGYNPPGIKKCNPSIHGQLKDHT